MVPPRKNSKKSSAETDCARISPITGKPVRKYTRKNKNKEEATDVENPLDSNDTDTTVLIPEDKSVKVIPSEINFENNSFSAELLEGSDAEVDISKIPEDETSEGDEMILQTLDTEEISSKHHALLSIDIGVHNLGYALLFTPDSKQIKEHKFKDLQLTFGVYDVEEGIRKVPKQFRESIVIGRAKSLQMFMNTLTEKYILDVIVIERQVNSNTKAMELMGVYAGIAQFYTDNIKIFDPKLKFTKIHETYCTESKQHKKQSIKYAERVLYTYYKTHLEHFYECDKRDDYSDALNQAIVYGIDEGYIRGLSLMEYRNIVVSDKNDSELRFGDKSVKKRSRKKKE